jgi:hypothetical protein
MKLWPFGSTVGAILFYVATIGFGQTPEKAENDTVRVTMTVNTDGSRTVYKFDAAEHKAVATTTGQDGKMREEIRYEMDEAGRFSSGLIFGPDGRLRFKSHYKYDSAGLLQEETQSAEDGTLLHRIVYSYDQGGKRTGYSIFDASGKLLGRTTVPGTSASPPPKARVRSQR